MKVLLQRVTEAKVLVDGQTVGQIGQGLLALVGAAHGDDEATCDWLAEKILGLRIFSDPEGKMNLSVKETQGAILLVSQFTLLADCRKGRRPSFAGAAEPGLAKDLYLYLGRYLENHLPVAYGIFGAHMAVSLINDGPVTVMLEKSPSEPT
ncbi:MAG: D-tyrosyl-tRNA(Tyr) deacylase [Deltaproteobacteria bacterium]|jgi:D-tyrosyl-tRNA(Tyr) deacylase|nr:D-tyrosyl-tRNA(Tyr) deacylase [Deltaproteobacteria bacterium]